MFFTGLTHGLAGAGGILVTTLVPILTFSLGCLFTMKKPSLKDSLGLMLGAIGAGIIMEIWKTDMSQLFKSGNLYFLVAALSWALLTHTSSRAKRYTSAYTFSFYLFLFTSLFDLILIYGRGQSIAIPSDTIFYSEYSAACSRSDHIRHNDILRSDQHTRKLKSELLHILSPCDSHDYELFSSSMKR